ncbi:hypothetical protein, partial [Phytobacter diazotrophicus]
LNFCSCQTASCFNKSKGVLITGLKLKAFRNPQPSWGFSIDNEKGPPKRAFFYVNIFTLRSAQGFAREPPARFGGWRLLLNGVSAEYALHPAVAHQSFRPVQGL